MFILHPHVASSRVRLMLNYECSLPGPIQCYCTVGPGCLDSKSVADLGGGGSWGSMEPFFGLDLVQRSTGDRLTGTSLSG